MSELMGKVALVTGAGRGIGRAIALTLSRAGAKIAITARSENELDEVAGLVAKEGKQCLKIAADLADRETPEKLIAQVDQEIGPIDILVNNAGVGSSANPKPVVEFDDAFWDLTLLVNLTAPYLLCKAVLPSMLSRRYGRIINIASINGKVPSLHGAAYTASKHGLLGLTRTLAIETAAHGITVNAICPGPVHTRMNDLRVQYDADRRKVSFEEQEASMTPLGRRLEPEEVAPLALFLAGDGAKAITGQAFNVCGGLVMY